MELVTNNEPILQLDSLGLGNSDGGLCRIASSPVSGLNSFHGRPNRAHVCASKMGAVGMTRALRMYRHFLVLFDGADPSFDEELERIRNRIAELASG